MNTGTMIYYVFGAITILSVLCILLTKNVLYASFALILTFIGLAGLYIFLGAEFIAITQILVYVGGILVLLSFGIMLTNRLSGKKVVSPTYNKFIGLVLSAGLFTILLQGIIQTNFSTLDWVNEGQKASSSIRKFGLILMTDYVLAFEIIGMLLLLALIGALRMAGKHRKEEQSAA